MDNQNCTVDDYFGPWEVRVRLFENAKRMGKKVFLIGEEYTAKTCFQCGKFGEKISKIKIFKCSECAFLDDRDVHAAFNIFLEFMKHHSGDLWVAGKALNASA